MKTALPPSIWLPLGSLVVWVSAAPHAGAAQPKPPPEPQSLSDFLDELSDNALSNDRKQLYRVDGQRRYVNLGAGWIAVLDEQTGVRLGSAGVGPATAGPPGRALAVLNGAANTRTRLYVQDDSTGREVGAAIAWDFRPHWALRTQTYQLRDGSTGLLRREAELGLRYGPNELWVEGLLRHAGLEDEASTQNWIDRKPDANFVGLRAFWQATPTLSLSAQTQRAIRPDMLPGDERLAKDRTEFGADYRPALTGALQGLRLYWREATELGLLASQGVDERSTYRSTLGASVPDGSPEGSVYTELRRHGLTNEDDALWVLGWRHTLEPAPQWHLSTTLETAEPVSGTTAIRSHAVGVALSQRAHPSHTLLLETEAVHTSLAHSSYIGAKYTERFTPNSLTAWRFGLTDNQPKAAGAQGTSNLKASVGWAWREPEHKHVNTLWRYSLIGRNAKGPNVTTPFVADRRAHILFGQLGYQPTDHHDLVLRGSQRWDRDESFQGGELRKTPLWVLRGSQDIGEHWVISAHVASLRQGAAPRERGVGFEVGHKLSRKVSLAVGYNPRGVDDSELELDDKLKKGVTLRLRFAIDAALSRWLDPPMPGAKPESVPIN